MKVLSRVIKEKTFGWELAILLAASHHINHSAFWWHYQAENTSIVIYYLVIGRIFQEFIFTTLAPTTTFRMNFFLINFFSVVVLFVTLLQIQIWLFMYVCICVSSEHTTTPTTSTTTTTTVVTTTTTEKCSGLLKQILVFRGSIWTEAAGQQAIKSLQQSQSYPWRLACEVIQPCCLCWSVEVQREDCCDLLTWLYVLEPH